MARLLLCPFSASFALFICALWVLFFFCIQTFLKDEKLREFFQIVSTNKDRKGKTFISTMEGKQLHHGKREWKIGTLFPVPIPSFYITLDFALLYAHCGAQEALHAFSSSTKTSTQRVFFRRMGIMCKNNLEGIMAIIFILSWLWKVSNSRA